MTGPADPPGGAGSASERASARLEEAARVRRSIAETIARVRRLTAGIGAPAEAADAGDPPSAPPEAAAPPPPVDRDRGDAGNGGHRNDDGSDLSGDVAALVERTRGVIDRTRRLLDKSRRESAERKGE